MVSSKSWPARALLGPGRVAVTQSLRAPLSAVCSRLPFAGAVAVERSGKQIGLLRGLIGRRVEGRGIVVSICSVVLATAVFSIYCCLVLFSLAHLNLTGFSSLANTMEEPMLKWPAVAFE